MINYSTTMSLKGVVVAGLSWSSKKEIMLLRFFKKVNWVHIVFPKNTLFLENPTWVHLENEEFATLSSTILLIMKHYYFQKKKKKQFS